MDIFQRPPSATWETLAVPEIPGATVWMWVRPPAAPCGIVFQIPEAVFTNYPGELTLRRMLRATGINGRLVASWTEYGESLDAMRGHNPALDRVLSPPPEGIEPALVVHLTPPADGVPIVTVDETETAEPTIVEPVHLAGFVEPDSERLFRAIETDWNAIRLLESHLLSMRKQMNATLQRLQGLNRDLSPEERSAADGIDNREWQEARRWLRDGTAVLARVVKSHDIGVISSAGNRSRYEDLMVRFITPRVAVPNLSSIQQQFEMYRKTAQSMEAEMQAAMHGPSREAEMRAMAVLTRVRGKVQAAKSRRPGGKY